MYVWKGCAVIRQCMIGKGSTTRLVTAEPLRHRWSLSVVHDDNLLGNESNERKDIGIGGVQNRNRCKGRGNLQLMVVCRVWRV